MGILIEPSNIISSNLKACFTTKGLISNHNHIHEALSKELNIPIHNIYVPIQKHTSKIHILESDFKPVIADAVITARRNMLVGVLVADCVPILLSDRVMGVVGAVHAGWRGTAKEILIRTINLMHEEFNCLNENILVAIGPSIRQCSYEVGDEVKSEVQRATGPGDYYRSGGDKNFIDLSSANKIQAVNMGIPESNIWQSDECTYCNPDRFYSYRYSRDSAGRQGGFIGMW